MKMDRCQSKGVAGGAFCKWLKRNGMDDGKQKKKSKGQSRKKERGRYTPMAMERVRKRLKGKGLRTPIAHPSAPFEARKSPEAVDYKTVEGNICFKA
jgi:hypothetical protein